MRIIPLTMLMVLSICQLVHSQSLSNKINPDWTNTLDWIGPAPMYDMNVPAELLHDSDVGTNDIDIGLGSVLTVGLGTTLTTAGNITVHDGGSLIVLGNVNGTDPTKNLIIDRGIVLVALTGDVNWAGGWMSNNSPTTLTINGNLYVGASFQNSVTVTGVGTISASGSVDNTGTIFGCILLSAGCCEAPGCTMSPGVLPVEWLGLHARPLDQSIEINWSTASEINNDYFTVERSMDGITFEALGQVDGAGNSSQVLDYSFIDDKPEQGVSYYRITQTDHDGTQDRSQVLAVTYAQEVEPPFQVYPNPATGEEVNIRYQRPVNEHRLTLSHSTGMPIQEWHSTENNSSEIKKLSLNHDLAPGTYLLLMKESGELHRQLLVIK